MRLPCVVIVLAAIQFDAQLQLLAVEVQNVRLYQMLPTKLAASQLAATQVAPEQMLGVGGVTS